MVNSRRAKRLDFSTSCPPLLVADSMARSMVVPETPARGQIADESPDTHGDADGLIRMLAQGLVGRLGALDCFVSYPAIDLFAAFQRGGQTLAGLANLFPGHVGGRSHQSARIFGQGSQVVFTVWLLSLNHRLFFPFFLAWFGMACGKVSRRPVSLITV